MKQSFYLFIPILLIACSREMTHEEIVKAESYAFSSTQMPIVVVPIKYHEDTLRYCNFAWFLYEYDLGMRVVEPDQFEDFLYKHCGEDNPIIVSDDFMAHRENNFVKKVTWLDSLYQSSGIEAVIDKVKEEEGDFDYYWHYRLSEFNYIAYLLWENNIFLRTDCETGMFILFDRRNSRTPSLLNRLRAWLRIHLLF